MDTALTADIEEAFEHCFGEHALPLGATDSVCELTVTLADDYAVPAAFRVAAYLEPSPQDLEDAWVVLQWTIAEVQPEVADRVAPLALRAANTGWGYRLVA